MKPRFYRKVLKNGMTLIFEKRDSPAVSVAFAVRCGGLNETASEKGISHFIEHLLYKGTPSRDQQKIGSEIESNGGIINGFTDETITAFWCKMPSDKADIALDVLSDMMKNPLFDQKEVNKEREVIFEEIKMYENNPSSYVQDEIKRLLYKEPFGAPLIGTEKTLHNSVRDKILKRFKKTYATNQMILCVVGDTDLKKVIKFAEENFEKTKGKAPEIKVAQRNKSKTEKRKGIDQANMVFAYHSPLSTKKENYAANVLSFIMGGGMSSRLFNEVRTKRNLVYTISSHCVSTKKFGYTSIYAAAKQENIQKIKSLILEEFKKVSKELTEDELNRVKAQMIGHYKISLEDSMHQMLNLLYHEIDGHAEDAYSFTKRIKEVKLSDVKKLANIKKYSLFALVPE